MDLIISSGSDSKSQLSGHSLRLKKNQPHGLVERIHGYTHVKCLEQCLAYSKRSININIYPFAYLTI